MKKYSFRLQRVLDIKEIMQKVRERELASALGVLESEKNTLKAYSDKLSKYQDEIKEKKHLSIFEFRFYDSYFSWLISAIRKQLNAIKEGEKEVDNRKKVLGEAFKEKQVIENLKQRSREEYNREFDKDQLIQSDEISSSKYFLPDDLKPEMSIEQY